VTTCSSAKSLTGKKLTAAEAAAFNTLERFGWDIWFIRNEHNADKRQVVLRNAQGDHVGVLTDDEWDQYVWNTLEMYQVKSSV